MKVLIVEDDETVRNFLNDVALMGGHETTMAENGLAGLSACKQFEPDLIVTDIEMPRMNGLEMLEKIRRFDNESIVVLITGHGSEEYAMNALRLGAHNYLKKPVSFSELTSLLNKYHSVVSNRTVFAPVPGITLRREFTMKFENNLEVVDKIVDHLILQAADRLSRRHRLGIHLGLLELLVNAMEHGNMEITYHEKSRAMEKNILHDLRNQRKSIPELMNRRVTVDFKSDESGCQWTITDQGKGFDWKSVPDPLSMVNMLSHNGRGIIISRRHFDEFEYQGAGNIVRVKKYPNGS